MRVHLLGLIAAMALFGACGGGESADDTPEAKSTEEPACSPSGSEVKLVAKNTAFDKNCLAVTAGQGFKVQVENADSVPHNLSIYEKEGGKQLFNGDPLVNAGQTHTYETGALDAGTYYFRCDVHPEMDGQFVSA